MFLVSPLTHGSALALVLLVAACRSGESTGPADVASAWERALAAMPPPAIAHRDSLRRQDTLAHLAAARHMIATAAVPAGAWRWQEVRDVALERSVYAAGAGDEIVAVYGLVYDVAADQIVVNPGRVLSYTPAQLAHVLVHEATHAVYYAIAREASGMTAEQMAALLRSCREVSVAFRIAAELVAYANQAAWVIAQPDSGALLILSPPSEQLAAAVRAARGGAAERRAFVALVRDNAETFDPPRPGTPACSPPPVVLRGPKRGAPVDPWSAVAEFSASKANLRRALSERSVHGAGRSDELPELRPVRVPRRDLPRPADVGRSAVHEGQSERAEALVQRRRVPLRAETAAPSPPSHGVCAANGAKLNT